MTENNLEIKGICKINFSVDNNCKIELLNSIYMMAPGVVFLLMKKRRFKYW